MKGMRNAENIEKSHVAFAALNLSHVRTIYACRVCECFLGERNGQAFLTDRSTKPHQIVIFIQFC